MNPNAARTTDGQFATVTIPPNSQSGALLFTALPFGFGPGLIFLDSARLRFSGSSMGSGQLLVSAFRSQNTTSSAAVPVAFDAGVLALSSTFSGSLSTLDFTEADAGFLVYARAGDAGLQLSVDGLAATVVRLDGGLVGPVAAGVVRTVPSGRAWTDLGPLVADGGAASVQRMTSREVSERLETFDYGFAVPAAAEVRGVRIDVERDTSNNIVDSEVLLLVGTGRAPANRASALSWMSGITAYGGDSDLFGATLTPAQVNDASFGAGFSVAYTSSSGNGTATIRGVQLTVFTCQ
jgi:hypothetical protein